MGTHRTSLTPSPFIEVLLPNQENWQSCIHVLYAYRFCMCFYDFSNGFWNCFDSVLLFVFHSITWLIYRYIMFARGICESNGEGNLVSRLVFFANTPPKHDISV